ncbi:hypothetical protein LUZ60_003521 [Juncus effusus]|nr:hypothetical protein LUZ60_003521 [Juncus effusus]
MMIASLVGFFSTFRFPKLSQFCFGDTSLVQQRYMAAEGESSRVTELLVRMDCNGCVQRIKRALNGIEGVYEIYTDISQQKLTVIGNADPERILKAIKRTKKTATICSHVNPAEPVPPANEEPPSGDPPAPEPAPPTEATLSPEPPKDPQVDQEAKPAPLVDMVNEYPHEFAHRDSWNTDPYYWNSMHDTRNENPYSNVTHSYNSYRPSNYVSEYEYASVQMPVRERADGGHDTSMFSDENPNACTIV